MVFELLRLLQLLLCALDHLRQPILLLLQLLHLHFLEGLVHQSLSLAGWLSLGTLLLGSPFLLSFLLPLGLQLNRLLFVLFV